MSREYFPGKKGQPWEGTGTPSARLEHAVTTLLSRPGDPTLAELDDLLTECAAEALSLRADRLRVHRELEGALQAEPDEQPGRTLEELPLRRRAIAAELERVHAMMGALRARRDRMAGPAAAQG